MVTGHVKDAYPGMPFSRTVIMVVLTRSLQTTHSYLVFVTVVGDPTQIPYETPPSALNVQRSFLPGPGEGLPLHSLTLHFEGVIRIEGQLLR